MTTVNSQLFEMKSDIVSFDFEKNTLLCKSKSTNKNRWIKKVNVDAINSIIEDQHAYYLSCGLDERNGMYLALHKNDGGTLWYIPGRAFFHIIYEDYVYIIFIDEQELFYLLKVNKDDGGKLWHYLIDEDLVEYSFKKDRILLSYASGKIEKISPITGVLMKKM